MHCSIADNGVVLPRVLEPVAGQQVHVAVGALVALQCRATGDPAPATHWDRNRTMLKPMRKYLFIL
jgi:hypothetical protein